MSLTIDQDFPGKASHCNMFFLSRSVEFSLGRRRNIMGKDAKGKGKGKGKGKIRAKNVQGGKCAAEKQDVKKSTDSLGNTFIAEMSSPR